MNKTLNHIEIDGKLFNFNGVLPHFMGTYRIGDYINTEIDDGLYFDSPNKFWFMIKNNRIIDVGQNTICVKDIGLPDNKGNFEWLRNKIDELEKETEKLKKELTRTIEIVCEKCKHKMIFTLMGFNFTTLDLYCGKCEDMIRIDNNSGNLDNGSHVLSYPSSELVQGDDFNRYNDE